MLELYASFDSDELESAKRFYPRWTGRRDKVSVNLSMHCGAYPSLGWCSQHGIPVYVFRLASFNGSLQKELNAIPEDRRHQRMCVFSPFLFISNRPRPMPTSQQRQPLGVYVPIYPPLLFRPPPFPSLVLTGRRLHYALVSTISTTYHRNDFDH